MSLFRIIFLLVLILLMASVLFSQQSKIAPTLQSLMNQSPDTIKYRVFITLKERKIFSSDEKVFMETMPESERQVYYLRAIKNFVNQKSTKIMDVITNFTGTGKAKLKHDLWPANMLSIIANKEVIETLGKIPEVKEISLVKSAPVEEYLDTKFNNNKTNSTNTADISWGITKIRANDVWDLGFTGQNITVAVIDMGFDYNHPDLIDHRWNEGNPNQFTYNGQPINHFGYDVFNNDNDPIYEASNETHGTQCAGIVAGDGTNGQVTGVAPDAKLMFIRCLPSSGNASEDVLMDALGWIYNMKELYPTTFILPKIISMSISVKFNSKEPDGQYTLPNYSGWRQLCYNNVPLNITHCNSIGDQGAKIDGGCYMGHPTEIRTPIPYNIALPGNVPSAWLHPDQIPPLECLYTLDAHTNSVIGVGGTNIDEELIGESGRGPSAWENINLTYGCQNPQTDYDDYRYQLTDLTVSPPYHSPPCDPETYSNPLIKPDVTAPSYVPTLLPGSLYNNFGFGGTSAAAPHVAGAVALMLSVKPDLEIDSISKILQTTAVHLGDPGKNYLYGAGRIDVYQAVKYIIEHFSVSMGGAGKTITFKENFTIKSGTTLTILPGSTVKFAAGIKLLINGSFVANGTSSQPITFTSVSSTPAPGNWYGLDLKGGPNTLKYCNINYATYGVVVNNNQSTTIENCNIKYCSNYGVYGLNATTSGAFRLKGTNLESNTVGLGLSGTWVSLEPSAQSNTVIQVSGQYGFFSMNSNVYMNRAIIQTNASDGMWINSGSNVYFSPDGYSPGYNIIANNTGPQIDVSSGGNAFIGKRIKSCVCGGDLTSSVPPDAVLTSIACDPPCYWEYYDLWGSNTIYGNSMYITNGGNIIYAHLTYWGEHPLCPAQAPPSYKFGGNPIYRSYPLCYSSSMLANNEQMGEGKANEIDPEYVLASSSPTGDSSKIIRLIKSLKKFITEEPDSADYVLPMLLPLVGPGGKYSAVLEMTWEKFLNLIVQTSPSENIRNSAVSYRIHNRFFTQNYNGVISLANAALASNPKDELWFYCQSQKIAAYLQLGDRANAQQVYANMLSKGTRLNRQGMVELRRAIDIASGTEVQAAQQNTNGGTSSTTFSTPLSSELSANYPNPFNPVTIISYTLPEDAKVSLKVYNVLGQVVATLVNGNENAGNKSVSFDAKYLPSGIYFYHLEATTINDPAKAFTQVKKMIVLK